MTAEELLTALSGMDKLINNVEARLNVLLVDNSITKEEYVRMLQIIKITLYDKDTNLAIQKYSYELDTHLRELFVKVLNEVYFL